MKTATPTDAPGMTRRRYFSKEIPSQPFRLPNGQSIRFDRAQNNKGVLIVDDEVLAALLDKAVRNKQGGVMEIDEQEYDRVTWNGSVPVIRTQADVVPTFQGQMVVDDDTSLSSVTYYHSGDLGDVIYAGPVIRELGGGRLTLGPENRTPMPTREPMTPNKFRLIAPLLAAQPYISSVEWSQTLPAVTYDLNQFRMSIISEQCDIKPGMNLARVPLKHFGQRLEADSEAWLTVDEPLTLTGKSVVISRSLRYHNPRFNWKEVMRLYGQDAIFLGTESEHREFCRNFGAIDYHKCNDLLEVARIIAGVKLFIGNQSAPYAIAEGLKQNAILEVGLQAPNCYFLRPNVWHVARTPFQLPRLETLTNRHIDPIEFNEDYFMRGEETGVSNYTNYTWMGELTHQLASAIVQYVGIKPGDTVLDFGCSRGYLVRALREQHVNASGMDISQWAIENCDGTVKEHVGPVAETSARQFAWVIAKDVLEHVPTTDLKHTVTNLLQAAEKGMFIVVPLSHRDGGPYVGPRDNSDATHVTRWTLGTWLKFLRKCSTDFIYEGSYHIPRIKQASEPYEASCGFLTATRMFDNVSQTYYCLSVNEETNVIPSINDSPLPAEGSSKEARREQDRRSRDRCARKVG